MTTRPHLDDLFNQPWKPFAATIAKHLGPDWRVDEIQSNDSKSYYGSIVIKKDEPQGFAISITQAWQPKDKLTISGRLDKTRRSKVDIGISKTRTPKAVASEVKRRLLDKYAEEFNEYQKRKNEENAWKEKLKIRHQALERIGARQRGHGQYTPWGLGDHELQSDDRYDNTVELTLRLPFEEAFTILCNYASK